MAEWDTAYINDLPDSAFAVILPGGEKDEGGKTVPRSLRKLPHHDAEGGLDMPHLRNAMSREPQSDMPAAMHAKAEAHLSAHMGAGKALMPVKALPLDPDEETAFWAGKLPRRLLAVPFGGPIPSAKSSLGVDLDGEWFSERTDIYGPFPELRDYRERMVDFQHAYAPPHRRTGDLARGPRGEGGMMSGHLIGKSILDPDPDEDGWWVDFWVKAGDKRVRLIQRIAERGAQLFGSTQPIKSRVDPETGEIRLWAWPIVTLATSPQNTFAVIRPKAALEALDATGDTDGFFSDLTRLLGDLASRPDTDLMSEVSAKAERARAQGRLPEVIAVYRGFLEELDQYVHPPGE